jgi:hypothetical protein
MNTDVLGRHYAKLTPLERFPLLMAAAARGDEAERERLAQSAPTVTYSLSHHWGAATSYEFLANFMLLTLLDLAVKYSSVVGLATGRKPRRGDRNLGAWDEVLYVGYEFTAHLGGWQKFCGELNVDPEAIWKVLPGYETVKKAEKFAKGDPDHGVPAAAFTAEGVARRRARAAVEDDNWDVDEESLKKCWPETADDIAAGLRVAWEELRKKWE